MGENGRADEIKAMFRRGSITAVERDSALEELARASKPAARDAVVSNLKRLVAQ